MATRAYRWSDNDRYFGPFTYAREKMYRPFAIMLSSGDGDDYPGCKLRFSGFGHTLIIALPAIIKPWRRWVDTSKYGDNPKGGYWDTGSREYGFTLSDGHLSVGLGRVTNDSSTELRWGCFLPWTQWRHVRHSYFGLSGEHLRTDYDTSNREVRAAQYESQREFEDAMPKAVFAFKDFDGEELTASTYIGEREWRFGTGWFKWLSLFRRAKIVRSLDISFSGETGKRKGSWKGGTVGHSIKMLPAELHEAAFRRYCSENAMTFLQPELTPSPTEDRKGA